MKIDTLVVFLLVVTLISSSCQGEDQLQGVGLASTATSILADEPRITTLTPFQPATTTPTMPSISTDTRTPRPTNSKTSTPSWTASITYSPTVTPTPLDEAIIEGIKGRWAAYNLDCEARSAVDWAAYFGVEINEIEFFNALPRSDDPEMGFVGDVNAPWGSIPPQAYGVHAKPVARLLRDYGLEAKAVRNITWDRLRAEITQGRPVIAWVVGRVGRGTPVAYTTSSGAVRTVARFEHTVIVTGYDKLEVTLLDGYWAYTRNIPDFLASWSVLENMAIIWDTNLE